MKKILLSVLLMVVMVFGTFAFVGCGGGETGEVVYNLFQAQITEMNGEGSPFTSSTKNNITSNYFLSSFTKKTSALTFADYGWQDEMIALGMNYISKYYSNTKDYKTGQNISQIRQSLDKLNESYQVLKEEYEYVQKISTSEDMTIYNGFMAKYGESAREFSICVYDCAQSLSDYLQNHVYAERNFGKADMDYQMISLYAEAMLLDVYNDYNDYLMESGKAVVGTPNTSWFALQGKTVEPNFLEGQKEKLVSYVSALASERKLTQKALDNFSCYEYVVVWNSDVKAYAKTNPLAQEYLTQIQRYFSGSSSHLSLAYTTLYSILYT